MQKYFFNSVCCDLKKTILLKVHQVTNCGIIDCATVQ
jgi:hypothetical protein